MRRFFLVFIVACAPPSFAEKHQLAAVLSQSTGCEPSRIEVSQVEDNGVILLRWNVDCDGAHFECHVVHSFAIVQAVKLSAYSPRLGVRCEAALTSVLTRD